jgi:hypothetical protein
MMADGLTKPLTAAKWPAFLDQIGLIDTRGLKTEEIVMPESTSQDRLDSLDYLESMDERFPSSHQIVNLRECVRRAILCMNNAQHNAQGDAEDYPNPSSKPW